MKEDKRPRNSFSSDSVKKRDGFSNNQHRKINDRPKDIADVKEDTRENIVEGRNPVIEVLRSGRTVEKLFVSKGDVEGSIKLILAMARDKGLVVSEVDRKKLDEMSGGGTHQGVIALVSPYSYSTIDDMLNYAAEKNEAPLIVILDEIEDPHNLGSIIRSANICGAHGIIIPKRRSAFITPTVSKASAGAVEHAKIAKVTNLNQVIKELKDKGLWIYGMDMDGTVCYETNMKGPAAIVVGSEGKGISRLVKENCDGIVKIPMYGQITSLNASVAAGIILYEITRQRSSIK
jgi:23S rRNA (guanosine2251-2'-O)-methyltransferase